MLLHVPTLSVIGNPVLPCDPTRCRWLADELYRYTMLDINTSCTWTTILDMDMPSSIYKQPGHAIKQKILYQELHHRLICHGRSRPDAFMCKLTMRSTRYNNGLMLKEMLSSQSHATLRNRGMHLIVPKNRLNILRTACQDFYWSRYSTMAPKEKKKQQLRPHAAHYSSYIQVRLLPRDLLGLGHVLVLQEMSAIQAMFKARCSCYSF